MPRDHRDNATAVFVVSTFSEDLTLTGNESTAANIGNESTAANIAAVLATLINELEKKGIVNATVSA